MLRSIIVRKEGARDKETDNNGPSHWITSRNSKELKLGITFPASGIAPRGHISGIRGQVVGRERLIALVQSERQCTAPAATAQNARPGGGTGPTVALEVTAAGVRGIADLGAAGSYHDEYVKTPNGWRFRSRTVLTPAEKTAGLDANEMRVIHRLAGSELADFYVADQNGIKRLRTSGVAIAVTAGAVTGRAYLKNGGYNDDMYEKIGPGQWRIKSRSYVPPVAP